MIGREDSHEGRWEGKGEEKEEVVEEELEEGGREGRMRRNLQSLNALQSWEKARNVILRSAERK